MKKIMSLSFFIILLSVLTVSTLSSCSQEAVKLKEFPPIIPKPQFIDWKDSVSYPKGEVVFNINSSLESGYYEIISGEKGVIVNAGDDEGLHYAQQSIKQLEVKGNRLFDKRIAAVHIKDKARFKYRGLMLDESRHFMGKKFVKKLLDEMERYKFNRFHWHLVDAGGWRIELKKYPELTKKVAYRTEEDWQKWWIEKDRKYLKKDEKASNGKRSYGGYYSQEEIKEIIQYAESKGITIIPEIELPGHSEEVLYVFPQLSCSGKALEYESDFCIGNEETFNFLENVLNEIIELFPSQYIHIGGDEASKSTWKECPKCQNLIKEKGLNGVDGLQSYTIHRIEKYLNSKGRRIIGWDEILDGGLSPNATVMSWRGEMGGITAANSGHEVIMTPNSHLYLDYYQENPLYAKNKAIGGYLTLNKVYSYDPIPPQISEDKKSYILGVQGNLWTEYVKDAKHAEYMLFPRILALSEVAWTETQNKDWKDFKKRLNSHLPYLKKRGINTYNLTNSLSSSMNVDYDKKEITIKLECELEDANLYYNLEGRETSTNDLLYTNGNDIVVKDSATLSVGIFKNGKKLTPHSYIQRFDYHKAIGKKVKWLTPLDGKYPAHGDSTALLDGYRGSVTYLDGRWLGNVASPTTIGVIDLEKEIMLNHVFTRCMHDIDPWVYMPQWVELSISSDGKNWKIVDRLLSKTNQKDTRLRMETFDFYPKEQARFIKIQYQLNAQDQFLFTDEIVVW